ncbi:MAG: AgmX/PglI C-terminal domain-containing protein [Kofleriaceae bacterium]|nr:AgmX/PglI C-terminal domain-containing protein [Kofleriaceae bacterium]
MGTTSWTTIATPATTALALALALAGCKGGDAGRAVRPRGDAGAAAVAGRDAAPAPAIPTAIGALVGTVPRVAVDDTAPLGDVAPPALLVIGPDGATRVGRTPTWAQVVAADFATVPVVDPEPLPRALLGHATDAGGDAATAAHDLLAELDDDDDDGGGDDAAAGGPVVTYGVELADDLGAATPLVVASPDAPAATLAATLAIAGGVILVDGDGAPRRFRIAFPWIAADHGGAIAPADALRFIMLVGDGKVIAGPAASLSQRLVSTPTGAIDAALLREGYDALLEQAHGAPVVVDVLAVDTTVQPVITAIAAARAIGARTIGVGTRAGPMPATGLDGRIVIGPLGTRSIGTTGSGGPPPRRGPVPQVSMAKPKVVGDLDKEIIRRMLRRDQDKIVYCYRRQLAIKPALTGDVHLSFIIDIQGRVVFARASGVDPDLDACVAQVVRGIEFPHGRHDGTVNVEQTITFRPDGK